MLWCLQGLKSDYYHAGMTPAQRLTVQTLWQLGRVKVVCATIAYGMGVDNPNVRYVVHFTVPKCIEGCVHLSICITFS